MRRHHRSIVTALAFGGLALLAPHGLADGTEALGPPVNLIVQQGSTIRVASVSLRNTATQFAVELPEAPVSQALLYWEAQAATAPDLGATDVLLLDGQVMVGQLIGGPTRVSPAGAPSVWTASYRSDVTGAVQLNPGLNAIPVQTVGSIKQRYGAGLVVILGDGQGAGETLLLDGNDFAFSGVSGSLGSTTPATFNFAPAPFDRASRIEFLVVTSDPLAPSVILVKFPDARLRAFVDLISTSGASDPSQSQGIGGVGSGFRGGNSTSTDGMAAVEIQLWIPAGADSLTFQVLSLNSGQGPYAANVTAALRWVSASFNIPAMGPDLEGCTPGYWKAPQHADSWPAPYSPGDFFVDVFGVDAFPGLTLLQVLSLGGGGLNALGRHSVAALLNAASPNVDYPMTPAEVITSFQYVFNVAPAAAGHVKNRLENHNEAGCPLN